MRANRTIKGVSDKADTFKAFDCELDVVYIHGFREPASKHVDPRATACFVCPFEVMKYMSVFGGGGYVDRGTSCCLRRVGSWKCQ